MSPALPKSLVALAFAVALSGCENPLIKEAKKSVSDSLNDPYSAKFTDVKLCDKPNAVEGYVNAKNLFGAYTGAKHFFYAGYSHEVLGEKTNFDNYDRLRNLCWSDKMLKDVDSEMNNMVGAADLLEKAADPPSDLGLVTTDPPGVDGSDDEGPMDDITGDYEPEPLKLRPDPETPPSSVTEAANVARPAPTNSEPANVAEPANSSETTTPDE